MFVIQLIKNKRPYGGHKRRTSDAGRRTMPRVWHKLPTGELKIGIIVVIWTASPKTASERIRISLSENMVYFIGSSESIIDNIMVNNIMVKEIILKSCYSSGSTMKVFWRIPKYFFSNQTWRMQV